MTKNAKVLFIGLGSLVLMSALVIIANLLAGPRIILTSEAPIMGEAAASQAGITDGGTVDPCNLRCRSPNDQYEVLLEPVDNRSWLEKLFGLDYSSNGLTRIAIVETAGETRRKEVATLQESDPGSGRSFSVAWSEDSKFLSIAGDMRVEDGEGGFVTKDINFVYVVNEHMLYAR